MGSLSIWHWLIVLAVVLVLFGGGSKISGLMGDFAKGIKSFKRNMADDESMEHGQPNQPPAPPPLVGQHQAAQPGAYQPPPQNYAAPGAAYPQQPPANPHP
ncbi:twin-arginine translocase TatA/TatE family subunit [Acetobacteraceae bacterium KSS8]|uniref:Sec-independent protein translocase protein TatA n=1 Tax=Endosaccharibacter trunci TaxID=2812733 RepID=A0ABT1W699_9PROT|nr:twin-arginine translocase TatA/TatE family subunit [Acetobacteraceae bacterium KSS8]